jgi:POT family proton-dependent oligopeptide transporter
MAKYLSKPGDTDRMPGGIPYIVGNEAAERFSFYGMKAILFVYMTQYLLSLDGAKDVMSDAQATKYVHLFTAAAYFFPIFGAIISDRFFGKYFTIISLSIVYCLGHVALALGDTQVGSMLGIAPRYWLAVGLSLIAIGAGGIKPCVSAHVGDQFGPRNQHMLGRVFAWFYFSINLGAAASMFLTPKLLEHFGPSVAFGVPGGLMLLATWVFWFGRRKFIHVPPGGKEFLRESLSPQGISAIKNLLLVYVFIAVFWSLFDQTASRWVQQAKSMDLRLINLSFLKVELLPSQLGSFNSVFVLALIPVFGYVIYPTIERFIPLTPLRKIGIGLFIAAAAFGISTFIESRITGGKVIKVKSERHPERWSAAHLVDGDTEGKGWISAPLKDSELSMVAAREMLGDWNWLDDVPANQGFMIRLRERRPWSIASLRLIAAVDADEELDDLKEKLAEDEESLAAIWTSEACHPRDVEVQTGDSPKGPWTTVARTQFDVGWTSETIEFSEREAEFVRLLIHSNWGGPFVSLSEIEVIASGAVPSDAHSHATEVWPNVAAIGFRPDINWQIFAYLLLTAAEIMVSITGLEFSYTQAPPKMKSVIMGLYLLAVWAGNLFTVLVNQLIQTEDGTDRLEGVHYYQFFTLVMLVTAIVFPFVMRFYRGDSSLPGKERADLAQK